MIETRRCNHGKITGMREKMRGSLFHVKNAVANNVVLVRIRLSVVSRIIDIQRIQIVQIVARQQHKMTTIIDIANHDTSCIEIRFDGIIREVVRLVESIVQPEDTLGIDQRYLRFNQIVVRVAIIGLQPSVQCLGIRGDILGNVNLNTLASDTHGSRRHETSDCANGLRAHVVISPGRITLRFLKF